MPIIRTLLTIVTTLALAFTLSGCSDGSDNAFSPQPEIMPVVFVHGQSGSAQQFETQAMRFTSNGYPQDMLFAFEYDTSVNDNPLADLDAFIDAVLSKTGASQVYAIGHSRGTSVWTSYLDDPGFGGPGKVARYVNIDGRSPEALPGGVPTIGIWGEWNTANSGYNRRDDNSNAQIGPDPDSNFYFAGKSHTEVATSAEAFALMYEFLTGVAPATTDVLASDDEISVSGRALFFPENEPYVGTTVELWEVEQQTGQRIGGTPVETFVIGDSGDFGPLQLQGGRYYEFAMLQDPTDTIPTQTVHHFYFEPFSHDNSFVRLLSSIPGQSISAFLPREADSTGLLSIRQREFWGDQGATSDQLFINGLNVLTADISPRAVTAGSGVNIAVFTFDDESDNVTDLSKGELFPFNQLTFLTGADVFIPATEGGAGVVEIVLVTRGGGETRLNVPNWPSLTNRTSLMFRDDTQ
jgi:pimeloyl-ACP methyl ester carboxylesterase